MPNSGAPTLDHDAVVDRLADAIQDGTLRDTLAELHAEGHRLADTARDELAHAAASVAAIDADVARERARLAEQLAAHGVSPAAASSAPARRPLHIVRFTIAPADVDRAVATLDAAGYRRLAPVAPAAWRAYRATRSACTFIRSDSSPLRVELTWSDRPQSAHGVLGRLLTPQSTDFEAVALPAPLWRAYSLVRLVRLPARLWTRRREPVDLGPFLQTPTTLIAPLLRFAGVSAHDLVVDLGCGDGRIAVAAAKLFGCRARGLETNGALVAQARAAVETAGLAGRVEILQTDASTAPLEDADVVVVFLPVTTVERLLPAVLDRMKPGARLVTHEQERLHARPAEARLPLISAEGITVAHRWTR